MFKNVVSLSLKLTMTTAHGHTVISDGPWTDDDDTKALYGSDDRMEPFALDDQLLQQVAASASAVHGIP